jgi:hypothetical protein
LQHSPRIPNVTVRKRNVVAQAGDQKAVESVAAGIRHYLASHPEAGDSVEGIHRWWLSGDAAQESRDTVERALGRLVDEGVLVRRRLPDGEAFYAVPVPRRERG